MTRSPAVFLVLPENRFAHAAILEGDRTGDEHPRPVFLYGPSGVGKTHLASLAMTARFLDDPKSEVQQWTASQFAAEFAEASVSRTIPLFQTATRQVELLILEDLQALEGRPETQVQLLSLTNELLANGCRLIWTCRKSPGELSAFLPRLVSRFRGGVLARLRQPGADSRRLLLEHFARLRRISITGPALRQLAEELPVSCRELQAAVQGLAALARHDRRPIDSDLVRKFLSHDVPPAKLQIDDVCRAVAMQFGVSATDLRSHKRDRSSAMPRHCAMWLARELTHDKLGQIGRYFGGRDHSTVVHSCQRVAELLDRDPELRSHLDQVRHHLGVPAADELPD